MRTGRTWLIVAAFAVAAVVAVGIVGLALGGGGEATSKADYASAMVNTRDRVDFSLGRLSKAQSFEELLTRMDAAAETIDDTAADLDDLTPPDAFEDSHERLVRQLENLAANVQGTADQARQPGFEQILLGAAGLDFPAWDAINSIFVELRRQGIEVQPLARHTTGQ
jgi:ABC-type transporter Mla subunit MlaD